MKRRWWSRLPCGRWAMLQLARTVNKNRWECWEAGVCIAPTRKLCRKSMRHHCGRPGSLMGRSTGPGHLGGLRALLDMLRDAIEWLDRRVKARGSSADLVVEAWDKRRRSAWRYLRRLGFKTCQYDPEWSLVLCFAGTRRIAGRWS